MALQIAWTKNALEDYEQMVNYLLKEWSVKAAADFIDHVEERIYNLSKLPNLGIASIKDPSVRSILNYKT